MVDEVINPFPGEIKMKCPKCQNEDFIFGMDDDGFYWVAQCNKCNYKDERKC